MNTHQLAYFAGLLDGEGCLSFHARKPRRAGGIYATPSVQVTNTNRLMINWLLTHVPGGYRYKPREERINRKESWMWAMFGAKARNTIAKVRPYLVVKAPQADVILGLYAAQQVFRETHSLSLAGNGRLVAFPREYHELTVKAVADIRNLNRRGPTIPWLVLEP